MNRLTEKRKYPDGYEYQIEDLYENTTDDCVDKLGKLEDLIDEMDSVRLVERDGITSLHIDMILTSETLPIVKALFKNKLK